MSALACLCGTCASCAGGAPERRPLDAGRWRHSAVRDRLLGRIGRVAIEGDRPLAGLGTRALDDPAIALMDAFAGGLHVVAWNAARLADDATLARGTDRAMLADLVALTGYAPRPALSASTLLAFTLDAFPGSPEAVTIPQRNRVASVPGPGELPISFETDEELEARAAWNRFEPLLDQVRDAVTEASAGVVLAGVETGARPGDMAAIVSETPKDGWLMGPIASVERLPNAAPPRTRVTFAKLTPMDGPGPGCADKERLVLLGVRTSAFGANAPDPLLLLKPTAAPGVDDPVRDAIDEGSKEWKNLTMGAETKEPDPFAVDLDGSISEAMPGRLALFVNSAAQAVGRIASVTQGSRKGFGLSGRVTRIVLGAKLPGFWDKVRETAIFIETGRETLLRVDVDRGLQIVGKPGGPVEDARDRLRVRGRRQLPAGRRLMIVGEAGGQPAAEAVVLKASVAGGSADAPWTELRFAAPVETAFRSLGAAVLGNVVPATQGESSPTGPETIGSGDATALDPRFRLARGPLGHAPASTPKGYAPALEVRVDGQRYALADNLHDVAGDARAFAVTSAGGPKPEIQIAGRIATGAAVTALYRAGAGAEGNLGPGRITTALAPTPGVRFVSNPVPADGGADPEPIEAMRVAAPRALRTMDRAVSLQDFETFAAAYRGVGKAAASELAFGARRIVALTVATTSLLPPGADLKKALALALREASPPGRSVRVLGFQPLTPAVEVALAVEPRFERASVEAAIRAALAAAFGRPNRQFGEALPRSAVLAAVQGVPGVAGAMLTTFSLGGAPPDHGRLLCPGPTGTRDPVSGAIAIAEAGLLAIDPASVQFKELAP